VSLPPKLNPQLAGMPKSATLAINERSRELRAAGRDVIRLGLGQSPFPVPRGVVAALRRHAHEKAYLPVEGLPALREAISDYLQRTEGLTYELDQILVGPGTKELMFSLQLALDADLLLPSPSWVSYAPQAHIAGRRVAWIPTTQADGLRLTPESLERACADHPDRQRLLILNYPGNPTGTSYSEMQLRGIAAVARRLGIIILSDEIYSGLKFDGLHISIARFYPEGTIVSNGLSKWCGAGGWRLGAFAFPRELDELRLAMVTLASETFSAVSAPIQHAAITAFEANEDIQTYLSGSRRLLRSLLSWSADRLRCSGASLPEPEGGFYLLPHFGGEIPRFNRAGRPATAAALCEQILSDTNVATLPGNDFGLPPNELFIRLALVDFDGETALGALSSLDADCIPDETFLRAHCLAAITGIERICSWIDKE
jgi:aspartate aminotransferase